MSDPLFLTLAEVVELHATLVRSFGGKPGVRDLGLLQSAIAQPEMSYRGKWLHEDLHHMAAAYAFHICQNHPFFDGNKRAGLSAALVFLEINGVGVSDPKRSLIDTMFRISRGELSKLDVCAILKSLSRI